jgi:BirA family biotin operon repressor/biotin-[acetyl-CoA-carboxylase] ligase
MFSVGETWDLDTRHVGRRVLVFPCLDSTNTRALELAGQPNSDGLALLADEQMAGRGQHGRTWLSSPRSSVLLSVLLYPPDPLTRPVMLTALAAVSVCEVAHRLTGVYPAIKWPNDILLHGRKVCGILIEQSRQGGLPATVVGIGLNVRQSEEEFQEAGLPEATSLTAMGATEQDSHTVARQLLDILDKHYHRLLSGEGDTLESTWQSHLGMRGERVVVECLEGSRVGRLIECGFEGLLLEGEDGSAVLLTPETILHIRRG